MPPLERNSGLLGMDLRGHVVTSSWDVPLHSFRMAQMLICAIDKNFATCLTP